MSLAVRAPGVFPVVSYLHVPGKMSRPTWISLGTAFLTESVTEAMGGACRGVALLTCAHVILPWAFIRSPTALRLPEEYRKARYVVGTLLMPRGDGTVRGDVKIRVEPLRLNIEKDIALLRVADSDRDRFLELSTEKNLLRTVSVVPEDPPLGTAVSASGYRGDGKLGECDSSDYNVVMAMPEAERHEFIRMMQEDVVGKQHLSACGGNTTKEPGRIRVAGGDVFHGMSGSPLLDEQEHCWGMLLNRVIGEEGEKTLVCATSHSIDSWLRSAFAVHPQEVVQ